MQKKLCSRLDNPSDIFWNHLSMPVVQNRISPLLIVQYKLFEFQGASSSSYREICEESKKCCMQNSTNDLC